MRGLDGRVAVVTGAASGIGRAIAKEMARHGARVVVSSRKQETCQVVANEINGGLSGEERKAVVIPANIANKEELRRLVDETLAKLRKIDILVCNAAVNPFYGPMKDMPDSAFEKILDVNILSNHWLIQMVLPEMVERRDGSIIIVSSIGGLRGNSVLGGYCISKAADLQMVRNLAIEYGPDNIRINAISPGLVRTDFARALWEDPEYLEIRTSRDPLRRMAEPREIAGAAVYLGSAAGSFTTGQNIVVDGGATIG